MLKRVLFCTFVYPCYTFFSPPSSSSTYFLACSTYITPKCMRVYVYTTLMYTLEMSFVSVLDWEINWYFLLLPPLKLVFIGTFPRAEKRVLCFYTSYVIWKSGTRFNSTFYYTSAKVFFRTSFKITRITLPLASSPTSVGCTSKGWISNFMMTSAQNTYTWLAWLSLNGQTVSSIYVSILLRSVSFRRIGSTTQMLTLARKCRNSSQKSAPFIRRPPKLLTSLILNC